MTGSRYFSKSYASARCRFIAAACAAGARMDELHLQAMGPDGMPLATEIAWLGAAEPKRAVIHSSGIHGVEGFAGSAIQLALLSSEIKLPDDAALIIVHCLNPYGMAWKRRVNENNVDLNRNFLADDEDRTGVADTYRRLNSFLNPTRKPDHGLFYPRAVWSVLRYGMPALRQAVAEGQYEYPKGLFFGGAQFEQGAMLYLGWLSLHLKSVRRLFAIDVHTGLGKWGQESLFLRSSVENPEQAEDLGVELGRRLITDPRANGAYNIRGLLSEVFDMLEPKPEWDFVLQEFGTYPGMRVLKALQQENRWHHYGDDTDGGGAREHRSKRNMERIFAPDNSAWRDAVVERGLSFCKRVMEHEFA